jgi:hypothetical protein
MSASEEFRTGYRYSLRMDTRGQTFAESSEMTKKEIQVLVSKTLGLMTSGCETCVYSQRLFCEKLRRPVKAGDTRCEFFSRRPSAAVEY